MIDSSAGEYNSCSAVIHGLGEMKGGTTHTPNSKHVSFTRISWLHFMQLTGKGGISSIFIQSNIVILEWKPSVNMH